MQIIFVLLCLFVCFCFLNLSGQEEKEVKPLPRINKHSVFWIVASVVVTYYVDFLRHIMENDDIKRWMCFVAHSFRVILLLKFLR